MQDIRWQHRFTHFCKVLSQLDSFIEKYHHLNELEKQVMIKSFWNTLKDFYTFEGETNIQGSRDAFKLAFQRGLIQNGELWMNMIADRNTTSHAYDPTISNEILQRVYLHYHPAFHTLKNQLQPYLL